MSQAYYEILLSGPAEKEQAVRAALVNAGVAPELFVAAHHGYNYDPEECAKGWVAYRADDLAAAELAVKQVKGWCLRLHRHSEALKIQPATSPAAVSPLDALNARMAILEAAFEQLTGKKPLPPMMGGALESPPWVIAADQHSADLFRQTPQSMLAGTGVVGSGDLLVTANSPAAMNVLVAAGQVWMPGTIGGITGFGSNGGVQSSVGNTNGGTPTSTGFPTTFTKQGSYYAYQDAQVTLAIASSDPTNPRIDLICASVQDAEWSGAANQAVLQVITGTPNASPAPTPPPANTVVVSSVYVPATHTTIVSSNLNDLRPIARLTGTALLGKTIYAPGTESQYTVNGSLAALDTTNLTISFIAPASGAVTVRLQADEETTTSNTQWWGLVTHGTTTAVSPLYVVQSLTIGSAFHTIAQVDCEISGLTPGTVYKWDWAAVGNTSSAGLVYVGPGSTSYTNSSPASIKVYSA